MTRRSTKLWQRRVIAERERLNRLASFRSASASRLRAARTYRIGAEVLGELSAEGRERWTRGCRYTMARQSDDEIRADAEMTRAKFGLIVAPDGSAWIDPPRLGPELPPDFPRFVRRL
jgi:hypothetical protein